MKTAEGFPQLLFVDHAAALGGAESVMLSLMERLSRRGWRIELACRGGPVADRARRAGIPVHLVPLPRLRRSLRAPVDWAAGCAALVTVLRSCGAAIAIANTVRAAWYGAAAARLAGVPFLWHMHDFWLGETRPDRVLVDTIGKRLLTACARRVIAVSRSVANHLPSSEKTCVIYDGIDVDDYHQERLDGAEAFRSRHGIPPSAPLVGTVGRLRPWKGQERFLTAAAQIRARVPGARFAIVGGATFAVTDDYAERLPRAADALGLSGSVVFTGHLDDVRPALAAFDLFVHPGDAEPFGLVNVEAMAAGKAVVAFAHGALPEIVADGETGLLAPPGAVETLAALVVELLQDSGTRHRMGLAGRQRAAACFSAERMTAEFESLLDEMLAGGRTR